MISRRALWMSAGMICCASAAYAGPLVQPPTPDRPAVVDTKTTTQATSTPASRRAKMVLGAKMAIQGDVSIGTVDDIVFNDDGIIEYLVVINDGKLVAVPWQAAKFNFDNRVAVVNITQERYREIPTFTVQTYPNFYEPTYRTQIYKYYGITPRPHLRIEQRRERP